MRWLRYILWFLLACVLLVVGAYAFLTSQRGLDYLARKGETLGSSDSMQIAIGPVRGALLRELHIDHIRLSDAQGPWLELEGLHIVWHPRQLLGGGAPLERVALQKLTLLRQPVAEAGKAESASGDTALSDYARYLPRELEVAEIAIAEEVGGMAQRLSLEAGGDAQGYRVALATLEGPQTALDATIRPQRDDFTAELAFREDAGGIVGRLAGLPADTVLAATAAAQGDTRGDISWRDAWVTAGGLRLEMNGSYRDGKLDSTARFTASDLAIAQTLSGTSLSGTAEGELHLRGMPEAWQATLALRSPQMMADGKALAALQLNADLHLQEEKAAGTATAALVVDGVPARFTAEGAWEGDRIQLSQWQGAYGEYAAEGEAEAQGTPERFALDATTRLTTPYGMSELRLDGKVDSTAPHYEGSADGHFVHGDARFELSAVLDASDTRARLERFHLKGPGSTIEGALDLAIAEQLADGKLRIRIDELAPLGRLLEQPASGAITADLLLQRKGAAQAVQLTGDIRDLKAAGVEVAQAELRLASSDLHQLLGLDAQVKASGVHADTLRIDRLAATANGDLRRGVALVANGAGMADATPWQFAAKAEIAQPQEQSYRVVLQTLEGAFDGKPIRLHAPATLTHAPTRSSVTPVVLAVAGGVVQLDGTIQPGKVEGNLQLRDLALAQLPLVALPEGTLQATAELRGTAEAPQLAWKGEASLPLDGIATKTRFSGEWKGGKLQARADMNAEEASVQARVELPASLRLAPFATDLGEATALGGMLDATIPLTMLNARLRADGHQLGGMVAGRADLRGTLGRPSFDGRFTLADGRYDHHESGVCLRQVEAVLTGTPQAVRLQRFSATDPSGKRFTAEAALALSDTPSFSGGAAFDRFRLFCGGMLQGQIDGGVGITGTLEAMAVAGKLTLGPLNVQIPGARSGSDIPAVEAEWVRPGETRQREEPGIVALDITMDAPNQLFVRGRGLDAEFGGSLHLTGTADQPEIAGALEQRRGKFVLLDRVMALKTAALQFQGPMPPSPFLNVHATTQVDATEIAVRLTGSASKPSLALSSSPARPQDEVLALLLFGRELERISPFEAIRLAQATRELAGLDGGGPGLLGTVRDALGVDTLDVATDDANNVSVTTGKYISDKVYVGVTQGAKPEDREIVTEITLTPSISGKTTVDGVGNQGVGLEWKRDY